MKVLIEEEMIAANNLPLRDPASWTKTGKQGQEESHEEMCMHIDFISSRGHLAMSKRWLDVRFDERVDEND